MGSRGSPAMLWLRVPCTAKVPEEHSTFFLNLEVTDSLHVRFLSRSSPSGERSGGLLLPKNLLCVHIK